MFYMQRSSIITECLYNMYTYYMYIIKKTFAVYILVHENKLHSIVDIHTGLNSLYLNIIIELRTISLLYM